MGKISKEDKIRIQTLCEQGWGYKRIVSAYPNKEWKQESVKTICRRFKKTGSRKFYYYCYYYFLINY